MKFAAYLASHARLSPSKEAVVCGEVRWTFAELDRRTDRLAVALQASGLLAGDRVALVLPSDERFVEAFIAVVKAGGIAVPVNTRLSTPEIDHIVGDCLPRFVFTVEATRERVRAAGGVRIGVDHEPEEGLSLRQLLQRGEGPLMPQPVTVDDCMICYTSGTTGQPKGAVLTQSNYVTVNGFMNALQFGLGPDERQLVAVSLAHRAGFARLANMILLGCTLVVVPKFEPALVADVIERERITVFGIVPTVGRMMLEVIEAAPARFASLRTMTVTGEAFPVDVKQRLLAALPALRLYSFFSQTEASGLTLLGPDEQLSHGDSVGRPFPGLEVRLVDAAGEDVTQSGIGEIVVRGGEPGRFLTMKGYFNRPAETAEALRDGWLFTGDMGHFDDEGYLHIVDRKKDMVVTGGYNVYCKEVERVLLDFPGVDDVAVFGVPDALYGEAVVAAIECRVPASFDMDGLLAHCRAQLAGYKKPRHVTLVESLPRNATGKVLKRALRDDHLRHSPPKSHPKA